MTEKTQNFPCEASVRVFNRVLSLKIKENEEISGGIFRLRFALPDDYESPEPGQFVNVYLNDESRMLPRPLSVCDWEPGTLTLVYAAAGKGTEILSRYEAGTALRVSTPLGNGFTPYENGPCILIGGGLGIAPLLYSAKKIPEGNKKAVLGFRSETFLTEEFPCPVEIATDDGSAGFKGNAVDLLKELSVKKETRLFACGPKPMLKALSVFAKERGLNLQVSLEERMGCGYGACVGCVCKTANGNKKVCEDGPVFNASEVIWDA